MTTRVEFLRSLGAATTVATGGIDVWDPLGPQIRVLVAADTGGASPQVALDGTFGFGGKRWRGAPSTIGMPDGRLALVTTIDVDEYLQGVVPLEAPPSWPAAALQAQAVVARTYALGRRTLSRPYDVRADDGDQRWGGVEAEAPAASAAIQATKGRMLTYGGSAASVYYSACCMERRDAAGIPARGRRSPLRRGARLPVDARRCARSSAGRVRVAHRRDARLRHAGRSGRAGPRSCRRPERDTPNERSGGAVSPSARLRDRAQHLAARDSRRGDAGRTSPGHRRLRAWSRCRSLSMGLTVLRIVRRLGS